MGNFDRGFKSWAERQSISLRTNLSLKPHDPLSAFTLAKLLGVKLFKPQEIPGLDQTSLSQLVQRDRSSWSAVTICLDKHNLVIYNSSHAEQRQSTDIMHELSHIIIGHKPSRFFISPDPNVDFPIRDFDKKQEEEADWLSGCLLLPRTALLHIQNTKQSVQDACHNYKVSEKLLNMRIAVTGIKFQIQRLQAMKSRSK